MKSKNNNQLTNSDQYFLKGKKYILSAIDKYEAIVEHIGSTAIHQLSAKPIIDIMVVSIRDNLEDLII